MPWERDVVDAVVATLTPLADSVKAPQMQAYMKDVAPFLGVQTPVRRRAVRGASRPYGPPPDDATLAVAAKALFGLPEREFAYAACDLIATNIDSCGAAFLADPIEELLTTASWWDTIDSLGSGAVSPLCHRFPPLRSVVSRWSASPNIWLVRAAIQHQRGWKHATDVSFVLELCAAHPELTGVATREAERGLATAPQR